MAAILSRPQCVKDGIKLSLANGYSDSHSNWLYFRRTNQISFSIVVFIILIVLYLNDGLNGDIAFFIICYFSFYLLIELRMREM